MTCTMQHLFRTASLALTLWAALAGGCNKVEPRTQVMLIVEADQEVRSRTSSLKVTIEGGMEGGSATADTSYTESFDGTGWPYRIALTPRSGERGRRYKIVLTAVGSNDEPVAIQRREGGFVQGKTLALVVHFEASCLGAASLRCSDAQTCDAGNCVAAALDEKTLPGLFEIDGGLPATGTTNQGVNAAGAGGSAAGSGGTGGAAGTGITTGVSECGDGQLGPEERCDTNIASGQNGSCPSQCAPSKPCETVRLEGTGCQAHCVAAAITARVAEDGCCPDGADSTNDPDCKARCGNGLIEMGETCDPIASCPTPATCTPANSCLMPKIDGAAELCTATCTMQPISQCQPGDGCCPSGCTKLTDSDCSANCGDGVIDPMRETCEASSMTQPCPTSCDDKNACTLDVLTGSAGNCNAACTHLTISAPFPLDGCCPQGANANNDSDCPVMCGNGVVERGELCDGVCPETAADCNDNDSCTRDAVTGRDCRRQCTHQPMGTNASAADGCCPAGANANSDRDCPAVCGNGVIEPGERCDGTSCPSNCNDNDVCTADFVEGEGCQRSCGHRDLGPNRNTKDGCCPNGANSTTDADCSADCGNNLVEPPELCDGNCPTVAMCNDSMACTRDFVDGTGCMQKCGHTDITTPANNDGCCPQNGTPRANANNDDDCRPDCGNGIKEGTELCDGADCPMSCPDDGNPCTRERLEGEACQRRCTVERITTAMPGDSCCPGLDMYEDSDCPAKCGNLHKEGTEECDSADLTMCVGCKIVEPPPPPPDGGLPP
ncbi:MAG TPA: hypothetical protein VJR89_42325 [Polyangiales bacterium]|nr:hypothetical protein [Polyangiales bacterium]